MKKITLFFILLLLLVQNIKTIAILGNYIVNQNKIAKELCINRFDLIPTCKGQCYLRTQFNDENNNNHEKGVVNTYKELLFTFQTTISCDFLVPIPTIKTSIINSNNRFWFHIFLNTIDNPPELV